MAASVSPFFRLLRVNLEFNQLISKTNNACWNHDHTCDTQGQLFCLFTGIFKHIRIIEDDAVIEVQQSDLVAEHIHQENIKESRGAGATYQ